MLRTAAKAKHPVIRRKILVALTVLTVLAIAPPAGAQSDGPPYSDAYSGPSAFADCPFGGPTCHSSASMNPSTGAFADDMGCTVGVPLNCDPENQADMLERTSLTAGTASGHAVTVQVAVDRASFQHAAGSTESGGISFRAYLGFVNSQGFIWRVGSGVEQTMATVADDSATFGPASFTLTFAGSDGATDAVPAAQPLEVVLEVAGAFQRTEPTTAAVPFPFCINTGAGCIGGVQVPQPNPTPDDLSIAAHVLSVAVT